MEEGQVIFLYEALVRKKEGIGRKGHKGTTVVGSGGKKNCPATEKSRTMEKQNS